MNWLSLHHSKITQRGTERLKTDPLESAIRYAARSAAASEIRTQSIPDIEPGSPAPAVAWSREHRKLSRKNAQLAEKMTIALPRQTSHEQRVELSDRIISKLTCDRAPAIAAIHDLDGKDADNPHLHLLVFDRDPETRRRVYGFSDKNSTSRARGDVADAINEFYESHGLEERVDHRSFKKRGENRTPQLHEGASARALEQRGVSPRSKPIRVDAGPNRGARVLDYSKMDQAEDGDGELFRVTRPAANRAIRRAQQIEEAREEEIVARKEAERREQRERTRREKAEAALARVTHALNMASERTGVKDILNAIGKLKRSATGKSHTDSDTQRDGELENMDAKQTGKSGTPQDDLDAELEEMMRQTNDEAVRRGRRRERQHEVQ